jgi:hypothetical protein
MHSRVLTEEKSERLGRVPAHVEQSFAGIAQALEYTLQTKEKVADRMVRWCACSDVLRSWFNAMVNV